MLSLLYLSFLIRSRLQLLAAMYSNCVTHTVLARPGVTVTPPANLWFDIRFSLVRRRYEGIKQIKRYQKIDNTQVRSGQGRFGHAYLPSPSTLLYYIDSFLYTLFVDIV
jgi:hypothetical protein